MLKMKALVQFACVLLAGSASANTYTVSKGEATYEIHHLLKTSRGTSKDVKGKVVCVKSDAECQFLFAAPIASFDSGNSNRDAHMKAAMKEAQFPLVTARGDLVSLLTGGKDPVLSVEVAGKTAAYPLQHLTVKKEGKKLNVEGRFTFKLQQHGIERPSLLGAAIDDEVPMDVKLELSEGP